METLIRLLQKIQSMFSQKTTYYIVYRFTDTLTYIDDTADEIPIKIQNLAGYLPCFTTLAEAEEVSENGKYQIGKIKTIHKN